MSQAAQALALAKSLGMEVPTLTVCGAEILSELEFCGGTGEAKIYPPSALRTLANSHCLKLEWGAIHHGHSEVKLAVMTGLGLAALEAHRS